MAAPAPSSVFVSVLKDEERPSFLGAIADIFVGRFNETRTGTEKRVALALKDLRGLQAYDNSRENLRKNIQGDAPKWATLRHPNVARFYGLSKDFGPILTLVTELYPKGTVMAHVRANPAADKSNLLKGVIEGLKYLHEQRIVHCDLRAANVLIDSSGAPRLVDYGLARYTSTSDFTMANVAGPCRWQAPELFQEENEAGQLPWTMMSDVYSFGMLVIEISTEALPFKEYRQDTRVILAVMGGTIPRRPSRDDMPNARSADLLDSCWDLLVSCWRSNPDDRPTVPHIRKWLGELQ